MAAVIDQMLREVRDDQNPTISPRKFARLLHIDLTDLASITGVHRNTMNANPGSSRVQDRLRDLLRVAGEASDALGLSKDDALYWMQNRPLRSFGSKTPLELVREGKTESVLYYIRSIESGYVG